MCRLFSLMICILSFIRINIAWMLSSHGYAVAISIYQSSKRIQFWRLWLMRLHRLNRWLADIPLNLHSPTARSPAWAALYFLHAQLSCWCWRQIIPHLAIASRKHVRNEVVFRIDTGVQSVFQSIIQWFSRLSLIRKNWPERLIDAIYAVRWAVIEFSFRVSVYVNSVTSYTTNIREPRDYLR